MDAWEMIDAERTEFADLCDSLTPEQWDTTTLCTAWRVRDVSAHVIEGATLGGAKLVLTLARYGFRISTMLEKEAIKHGSAETPDELRAQMRATVGVRSTPPGVKPPGVLTDEVIHQQDIRRVLGTGRSIDPDRLRVALDEVKATSAGILPGKKRVDGLHLHATDMDWETGEATAPDVTGTGEALLMAMAGRAIALADLSGSGVETLRARL